VKPTATDSHSGMAHQARINRRSIAVEIGLRDSPFADGHPRSESGFQCTLRTKSEQAVRKLRHPYFDLKCRGELHVATVCRKSSRP